MSMSPSVAMLVSPRPREHYKHILPVVNPPVKQDRPWGQILELAVPNVAANLIMYSTAVVTTLCISSLDQPDLLASFGLGNLIGNVLGLSIGVGLTSVLETLVSQSYGAGNVRLASIHLNRARIVVTAALFPCAICLWYTDQLLLWLGQDPTVCALAATFTRATIPGLLPFFYNCCTSSYLRSCQHPRPPLIANIIGSISHVFVCIYLVNTLGLGMLGAGLATTINNILRFVILEVFLSWKSSELHGHSWDPETLSWKGIHHFLGLGLPSFVLVFSEWAAFELNSVIAGWVSTEGLAAHVAGINILAIVYMFPYGVSQSLSTLIGASLGEGLPKLAIEFTNNGRWLMFGIACIYGSLIYIYRDGIARIYSTDETMLEILTSLLTLCGGFVIFDAMNTTQAGIIRGLGLQTRAAKYQTFAMFGVMLPFGYIFYHQLGVNAVWWGAMLGMTTSATLFYSLIYHCDYYECSRRAISESVMAIFALRGVLQPALTFAYLATYAIPLSYERLADEIAGVLIGLSMICTCLVHFRCRSTVIPPGALQEPLMAMHASRSHYEHRGCSWIFLFAITFEIGNAIGDIHLNNLLILSMIEYAILVDITNLTGKQIVCYMLAGFAASLVVTLIPILRPTSLALMTGILFGSVAAYSLPLWDKGKSTSIGFTLGTFSLLVLFVGAATLDIIQ